MSSACALAQDSSSAQQPSTPQQAAPPLQTTVTVNATLATEAPEAITVLNQQQIEDTPGIELDDRLRQVPGFSLFRRTSSVVANPTTQGVSLRGIGSSGASRTLVLWMDFPSMMLSADGCIGIVSIPGISIEWRWTAGQPPASSEIER
jgi:outer membrane receptor for ferrienterochelin and colicin